MNIVYQSERVINHKKMRIIIGLIAFFMSPLVVLTSGEPINSISESYWTDARDIFIGSLCVVGFFLFCFNGTPGIQYESWLNKAACFFAIGIAMFPTEGKKDDNVAYWVAEISNSIGLESSAIHYICAIALFVCLLIILRFFSKRAKSKGALKRSLHYHIISVTMILGMILFYLTFESVLDRNDTILWVEAWGLTTFGIGWLRAGVY